MVPDDADDQERRDREIHINELKRRAEAASGGQMSSSEAEDAPPEVIEQFWEQVVDWETAPQTTHMAQLAKMGIDLPAPEDLDDATLSAKLWELLTRLGEMHVLIESTDHLSDRELYSHLWSESLREEVPDLPFDEASHWHIDLVSSGSEEDIHAWLKYYADDETRRQWKQDWPEDVVPEHEDPPFDRDRHMPWLEGDDEPLGDEPREAGQ
jgi:hypothetical protein